MDECQNEKIKTSKNKIVIASACVYADSFKNKWMNI